MRISKTILKDNKIFFIALAAFLIPLAWIEYDVLQHTNGTFSYPLDDSFIHLAIAKTLAFKKVWGISGYEFASASSSILYPILLAVIFFIFGAHTIIGFIVNLIAGILLLFALQRWLAKQQLSQTAQLLILLAVIILTPLPVIVVCGMEHTLQFLFCFLFITLFSECAAEGPDKLPRSVYIYALLVVATRYEGMALVAVACLLLASQKKWLLAFQLGFISFLPILLFGIISISKGSFFVPNSVLLKSGAPPMTFDGLYEFFTQGLYDRLSFSIVGYNTVSAQRLLFLLPLSFLLFIRPIKQNISFKYMLILLMAAVMVHLAFAGYVHFPRYEAWLIGCSSAISGALLAKYGASIFRRQIVAVKWVYALTGLFIIFPLFMRSRDAFHDIAQACVNIYEQQYQMGQLLHTYYNREPVAIGDIGAVSYFTEGRNLDLVGLASIKVARSKKGNYYTPQFMDSLTRQQRVQVAICYDYFTMPELRSHWTKVATWTIPNNVTCGDATVSIYSADTSVTNDLKRNLLQFEPRLPSDVSVKYYYDIPPDSTSRQAHTIWSMPPPIHSLHNTKAG